MLINNLSAFPFGTKVTSRKPPQPEMTFVVRGRFRLVHGETMPLDVPEGHDPSFPDLVTQGGLSAESFGDDDDPLDAAPLCPNDFVDFKLRGEVMVLGTCHAPGGKPTSKTTVGVSIGSVKKRLDVIGPRVWSDRLLGAQRSDPLPFETMAVSYDNAFGGPGFELNPVGKGVEGNELPTIEHPGEPVRGPGDRPQPAGFGPLNPEWAQRKSARGKNYGKDYENKRAPFYSDDFDWRFFQCAPADQQIDGYFAGDEELTVENLHPEHPILRSRLPGIAIRAFLKRDEGEVQEITMKLDTVFVQADEQVVLLTWRGLTEVREIDFHDVVGALIASEPIGEPQPAADYIAQLEAFIEDPLQLPGVDKAAAEKAHADGLARLDATLSAAKEVGKGGDAELGGEIAKLVDVTTGSENPDLAKSLSDATGQMAKQQGEHAPDAPDLSELVRKAQQNAPKPDPPPLRVPTPEKMGRPIPELVAALEEAHEKAVAAEAEAAKAGGDDVDTSKAETGADKLKELIDSPLIAGLRGPPPRQPEPHTDLSEQDYRERDLRGADMTGCNLTAALLTRADLRGAILKDCDLSHAVLYGANLEGADLSGAKLHLTNFEEASGVGAKLIGAKAFQTLFDATVLSEADLSGFVASYTVFTKTDLRKARLRDAKLEDTLFDQALLSEADAAKAELSRCHFLNAEMSGASFDGARLDRTSFGNSSLKKARFIAASGVEVVFMKAVLDDCDFSRALLPRAFFNEASACKAKFVRAYLKGARFYRTMMTSADLSEANLYDADFRHAKLDKALLVRANLFQADLTSASGKDTNFENANLKRCKLPS